MATDIDICNLALGSIGLEPISTLADETQRARTCNLFYDRMRQTYLAEYEWSFCGKIIELTEETTGIEGYGWAQYKYSYPADCLKARRVTNGDNGYEYPFVIRDAEIVAVDTKLIFTNLESAFLEYTLNIDDPDLFSETFLMALSKKLAFEISWPLTKSAKVQSQMWDQFLLEDARAKQKDGSEQLPEPNPLTWEQSRTGRLYGYQRRGYGLYN